MAGDLNLKKSWNPALVKNQKKVWEEEQAKLDELKRIRQLNKEHDREQEYLQMLKLQHGSDFDTKDLSAPEKLRLNKLGWMYEDMPDSKPVKNDAGFIERNDELPDKAKVESLLAGNHAVRAARNMSVMDKVIRASSQPVTKAPRRLDDDPLLKIQRERRVAKFASHQSSRPVHNGVEEGESFHSRGDHHHKSSRPVNDKEGESSRSRGDHHHNSSRPVNDKEGESSHSRGDHHHKSSGSRSHRSAHRTRHHDGRDRSPSSRHRHHESDEEKRSRRSTREERDRSQSSHHRAHHSHRDHGDRPNDEKSARPMVNAPAIPGETLEQKKPKAFMSLMY